MWMGFENSETEAENFKKMSYKIKGQIAELFIDIRSSAFTKGSGHLNHRFRCFLQYDL
jgi:hypothetical protein